MDVPVPHSRAATTADGETFEPTVTRHVTSPGKLVFVERANSDGWIATDLVVDLEP